MIKSLPKILICFCIVALMSACNKPKIIPDEKIKQIFKEIYLANAYCDKNSLRSDTIDIYKPIFDKYGYTPEDFKLTINSFSRRKSARLSDVIESAIKDMEVQYNLIAAGVAKLDTIDARAADRFKKSVYYKDSIRVRRNADTSKLRIEISPVEIGSYKISYAYKIDTADHNGSLRVLHHVFDSTKKQLNYDTHWMSSGIRKQHNVTINITPDAKKLVVLFGGYPKDMTKPYLDLDSISIVHYIPQQTALDSINKLLIDYKLLIDDKEWSSVTKDSSTLHTIPPRVATKPNNNGK